MAEHGAISNVYFGLNPMWVATCILLVTYAVIISEKINRSIVALIGAGAMVLVGVINQEEALKGVDWNTIGLLTGMMILVSISRRSGMFQYLAIWSARAARAHPAGILFLLQITTAVLSAFLDNVTTVLLIVPVTLAITRELHVPPYPFLFAEISGIEHWRHRHVDRRPAQHPDRLAGRPRLQRLRHPPGAGHRRGDDYASHHDAPCVGKGVEGNPGAQGPRHGHDPGRGNLGLEIAQAVSCRAHRGDDRLRFRAAAASRAGHHRHAGSCGADAARQLGAPWRKGRQEPARDVFRRRMDHDLLFHRPVHRGAWRRGRRPAAAAGGPAADRDRRRPGDDRLRNPLVVRHPVRDRGQYSLRRPP